MKHTQQVGDNIYSIDLMDRGKEFTSAYLIKGKKLALIECGPTSSFDTLLAGLQELGVDPYDLAYLIVTHIHLDHAGGAGYLAEKLPQLKVLVHEKGAKHLVDPSRLATAAKAFWGEVYPVFGGILPVPSDRILPLQDGAKIDLGGGRCLNVIETVGHSPHHHVFYDFDTKGLFSGDALGFYCSRLSAFLDEDIILPAAPHPTNHDMMLTSLHKMALLNVENIYYSHFGSKKNGQAMIERAMGQLSVWCEIIKRVSKDGQQMETAIEQINNYVFRSMLNQGYNFNLSEHQELSIDKKRANETLANSVRGLWHSLNRL